MRAIDFEQSNKNLGAPEGQEENVFALPVFTNGAVCISCWEMNEEERREVSETGKIWLGVWSGVTQPPVLPWVKSPFVVAQRHEATQQLVDSMIDGSFRYEYVMATNKVNTIFVTIEEWEYILAGTMGLDLEDREKASENFTEIYLHTKKKGIICVKKANNAF